MNLLRIALAQCPQSADLQQNEKVVFEYMEEAARENTQILCFPETQTVGYRVDVATPAPETPVPVEWLNELHERVARRCGELGMACILGTEIPNEEDPIGAKPYNSVVVADQNGKILGTHHKTKLTPLDAVAYSPGNSIETWDLFGVKVGVVICFEGFRFAETTAECVRQGAQLVFHPQNNTTRPNDWKIPVHHAMITTRAAENTIWFASCNAYFPDHQNCSSMIVQPDGRILAQAELRKPKLLTGEIDIDQATQAMFKFDMEACAKMLFSDTVDRTEYESILAKK